MLDMSKAFTTTGPAKDAIHRTVMHGGSTTSRSVPKP
jgi:hypothetical protein